MYLREKNAGVVLSLKNAVYALYEEYKKKLAHRDEAEESFEVSTTPVMENVEKEKSRKQTYFFFASKNISLPVVVLLMCIQN